VRDAFPMPDIKGTVRAADLMQTHNLCPEISGRSRALFAVLLVAVMLVVFWQTTSHEFVNYDDQAYVSGNSHVQQGLTQQSVAWAFTTLQLSNWHPVTWLSYMLDFEIYGLSPFGYHLTNLCFHLANTLLLLYLLYRLTGDYWQSLFAAALFGLHPLHVESVAWIAERKDLLSAFFLFVTLIVYGRYAKQPRPLPYLLALALYALGLMAKPMLVTLPFLLLLWDYWPLGRWACRGKPAGSDSKGAPGSCPGASPLRLVTEKIPFFALSLASCVVTYYAQQRGGAVASTDEVPLIFRLANALQSYLGYLTSMVWPHNLAVIYPLPATLTAMRGAMAGVVLAGASLLLCRCARRHPFLLTGWLWYLGTLVPVIGLVQVGQQAMADRYTYLPLIGPFIMVSWGVPALAKRLPHPRAVVGISAGLALAALTVCSWVQSGYWKDSVALFERATRAVSDNHIAYRLLGNALAKRGRFSEAEGCFRESLRIRPGDERAHIEWALALAEQKRDGEAMSHYRAALQLNPASAKAHYNLGIMLAGQGRGAEAIGHYLAALRIEPGREDTLANLGAAYAAAGNLGEAVRCYREALRADPGNAELLYDLGSALAMEGDFAEGIDWLNRALVVRPAFAEAHYTLAIALTRRGEAAEGIRHFTEALRINPGFQEARQGLAVALKRETTLPAPRR
jgi:tetratricopeptide (TPR) repeat protein